MYEGDELIQLADLLGVYPEIGEKNFQQKISAKKEFADLASDSKERLKQSRGGLFRHQEFVKRYMRNYDHLLLIHETGTGKTCSVGAFLEYVYDLALERDQLRRGGRYQGGIKRAIVLVGGPNQVLEFKYQMACKCTDGQYEPYPSSNEKAQKGAVTTALQDWYTVETYRKFWSMLEENYPEGGFAKDGTPSDEALERDFSDVVIWMDEVHNLRLERKDSKKMREKTKVYSQLLRFLHLIKRSKVILSTATPMINEPYEIRHIMNLILPLNMQIGPEFDFENATLEQLRPYFQGRISFVRALDTGAVPVEIGEVIKVGEKGTYEGNYGETFKPEIKVYTTTMSPFQSKAYDQAWIKTNQEEGATPDSKRSAVYQDVRQAATFVFPDGSWGGGDERKMPKKVGQVFAKGLKAEPVAGFVGGEFLGREREETRGYSKYVTLEGERYRGTPELMQSLRLEPVKPGALSLRDLSSKFYDIVKRGLEDPGNFFVYCNYLHGSGAIVLALALEANGFEVFDSSRSIFSGKEGSTIRSYCSGSQDSDKREIIPSYRGKRLRYALLSGDTQASKTAAMLEAMNSWENRHGDIIKILIATPTARDGMNVNNVLQTHLVDPDWTPSGTYQALSRGLRATSHVDLIAEMIQNGVPPEEAKVEFMTFKHSAEPLPYYGRSSIDAEMYLSSEIKDRYNRRVLRSMKRLAVDCQIHRKRNIRDTDADFSQTCDYDLCDYACADPPPPGGLGKDFSTYDVYYIDKALDKIIKLVSSFLSLYGSLRYREFGFVFDQDPDLSEEDLTNLPRRKIMALAIAKMIEQRIPVIDALGYRNYVLEEKGVFYISRDYPTNLNTALKYDSMIYNKWGRGLLRKPLSFFLQGKDKLLLEELEDESQETLGLRIRALPTRAKIELLEEAGLKVWQEILPPEKESLPNEEKTKLLEAGLYSDKITSLFRNSFFASSYPAKQIAFMEKGRANPGRGRPRNPNVKRKIQKLQEDQMVVLKKLLEEEVENEPCLIHTVFSNEMRSGYNQVTFTDNAEDIIRLYRHSENAWRNVEPNTIEFEILNQIAQLKIVERKNEVAERSGGIYGSFYADNIFRIHDTINNKKSSSKQFENSGRDCRSWEVVRLIDLCLLKGVPPPVDYEPEQAIEILTSTHNFPYTEKELRQWEPERLRYFAGWYSRPKEQRSQDELCKAIKDKMTEKDEIYYVY